MGLADRENERPQLKHIQSEQSKDSTVMREASCDKCFRRKKKKVERDRRKEGRVKGAGKLGGIKTEKEKIKAGEQSRGDTRRNRRRKKEG